MKQSVFVTRQIPDVGLRMMSEEFSVDVWEREEPPSVSEIISRAKNAQGLVTLLSDRIDRELLQSLCKVKVIAQYAAGVDNIDLSAATERGILVTNTPGVLTETTADLAWALIMAASRRVAEADRYVRAGEWKVAWTPSTFLGNDICGSTLGILGMGRIGLAVARRAMGFSMRILYFSRSETDITREAEATTGARRVNFETLLRESDILSIHVPLNTQTRALIGERELRMMKPSAVLVNTSRGPVIDENALARVLTSGHLAGVGLDVFEAEPLPLSNPLLSIPRVVLTPHIGSASHSTRNRMAAMCVENLVAALHGRTPPNLVNPKVLRRVVLRT
ncbi:MAG: D-glycerate dehydrogenase [Candidatus Thorarchaeota archaeon]|nr:D-glycerate dehydrogenase [Candidatus Thorarchaeota archaeon]